MALKRLAAYSGAEGVELARHRPFDFLVTGVVMPEMNGIEAAIQIHDLLPKCKVVLVSGDHSAGALLQGALARGYEFEILAKPVPPLELIQTLLSSEPHSTQKNNSVGVCSEQWKTV